MGMFDIFKSRTPPCYAAKEGDLNSIQDAIEHHDPELNSTKELGYTPLHITIVSRKSPFSNPQGLYDECTLALLEAGCSPNSMQGKGCRKPILSTFTTGKINLSVIKLLVSYGATQEDVYVNPTITNLRTYIKSLEKKVKAREQSLKDAKEFEQNQDYLSAMQEYEKVGNYWHELYLLEKKNLAYKMHYLKKALGYYQLMGELSLRLPQGSPYLEQTYKDLFSDCADTCDKEHLSQLSCLFAKYVAHATAGISTKPYLFNTKEPFTLPTSSPSGSSTYAISATAFNGLRSRRRLKTEAMDDEEKALLLQMETEVGHDEPSTSKLHAL